MAAWHAVAAALTKIFKLSWPGEHAEVASGSLMSYVLFFYSARVSREYLANLTPFRSDSLAWHEFPSIADGLAPFPIHRVAFSREPVIGVFLRLH